jgi:hypothetical protein
MTGAVTPDAPLLASCFFFCNARNFLPEPLREQGESALKTPGNFLQKDLQTLQSLSISARPKSLLIQRVWQTSGKPSLIGKRTDLFRPGRSIKERAQILPLPVG